MLNLVLKKNNSHYCTLLQVVNGKKYVSVGSPQDVTNDSKLLTSSVVQCRCPLEEHQINCRKTMAVCEVRTKLLLNVAFSVHLVHFKS